MLGAQCWPLLVAGQTSEVAVARSALAGGSMLLVHAWPLERPLHLCCHASSGGPMTGACCHFFLVGASWWVSVCDTKPFMLVPTVTCPSIWSSPEPFVSTSSLVPSRPPGHWPLPLNLQIFSTGPLSRPHEGHNQVLEALPTRKMWPSSQLQHSSRPQRHCHRGCHSAPPLTPHGPLAQALALSIPALLRLSTEHL